MECKYELFVVDGLMTIFNVTYGFFNNICTRRDIAISVSQENDDGQHPVVSNQASIYNSSTSNIIFNGRPNIGVVNPTDCVGKENLMLNFSHLKYRFRYGL